MKLAADQFPKRDHIVVAGQRVAVDAPTILWADSGLECKIGGGARRRFPKQQIIDMAVCHWTGSENDIPVLFNTLDTRELGVEFAIDAVGNLWQFCDPVVVDTFDAGSVNSRSVGVEIVNHGFVGPGRQPPGEQGRLRDRYTAKMHGRSREFARFFPAQINTAVAWLGALTTAIPTIKRQIPTDRHGAVYPTAVPADRLRQFAGVVGHFQLTVEKSDPGLDLLGHLLANGYAGWAV